jgi:hypothetical protein
MIVETANVNAENGNRKCQSVTLKLQLRVAYVLEAEYLAYKVKGFDIVLRKR